MPFLQTANVMNYGEKVPDDLLVMFWFKSVFGSCLCLVLSFFVVTSSCALEQVILAAFC